MTLRAARAYVAENHRHHKAPQGGLWAVGCEHEGKHRLIHVMSMETDLLGDPVRVQDLPGAPRKRKEAKPWGYFAPPGSGPEGHTCGDCRHHYLNRMAKTYHKCYLAKAKWTGGRATDILVRSPACRGWTARETSSEVGK